MQEIRAPEGYIITEAERTIELRENEVNHIIIENTKTTGITICKTDADTGLPIPGATFELYSALSQLLGTYKDEDKDGYVHITNIEPGRYFIIKNANNLYNIWVVRDFFVRILSCADRAKGHSPLDSRDAAHRLLIFTS